MPIHPKTTLFSSFKGLNNVLSPDGTPADFLKTAENIDIDKKGGISKRKGYTLKDSGNYKSLWASNTGLGCYALRNENLVEVLNDFSISTVRSGLGTNPISFEEIDNKIYYSSIDYHGIIDQGLERDWGIPKNLLAPTLTEISGSLSEGIYQVAFTYVNSAGIESGVSISSQITVSEGAGISLIIPSNSDPDIVYARVYCSTQNGNTLYFSTIGTLNSTVTITSQSNLITPLRTFGLDAPPLGHIIKYYRGRMFIAQDNILWFSEPYQYEHFDLHSNYIEFPERIREVMPVEDGIWIGSDRLYYLSGEDALTFKRSTKENVKVVEGTAHKVSGSYVHLDNTPIGYKWLVTTDIGIFILFNQGLVINMTSENIALDQANSGTALFIEDSGINRYLSILKTNTQPNNAVIGDLVETTIIRNGIVIT